MSTDIQDSESNYGDPLDLVFLGNRNSAFGFLIKVGNNIKMANVVPYSLAQKMADFGGLRTAIHFFESGFRIHLQNFE